MTEILFDEPVTEWMVSPVATLGERDTLETARHRMDELRVSGLPVVDGTGRISGVLSRFDLLRAGRIVHRGRSRTRAIELPDERVRDHKSGLVEIVGPSEPLRGAVKQMVRRKVHRIYVSRDRVPKGVVSTLEAVRAVALGVLDTPIGELASESIVSVRTEEPISLAVDRLVASHRSILLVLEDGWPVGIFGQEEALAARNAPAETPVGHWCSAGFLAVAPTTPIHRVAERVHALRPRCAVVAKGAEVIGLVTGMDFAEVVARA